MNIEFRLSGHVVVVSIFVEGGGYRLGETRATRLQVQYEEEDAGGLSAMKTSIRIGISLTVCE